jgi:tetratricopeptide (TPR) repeat protein
MIEQHYTDEALLSLLDARGSDTLLGDPHLAGCATCADALESYRDIAGLLNEKEVWEEEDDLYESAPVPETLSRIRAFADATAREDADAVQLVDELLALPSEWWAEEVRNDERYHTAGVVRRLVAVAHEAVDVVPAQAEVLTGIAIDLVGSLDSSVCQGESLQILRGLAWRERALALQYGGHLNEAYRALDRATAMLEASPSAEVECARTHLLRSTMSLQSEKYDDALAAARFALEVFKTYGLADRTRAARWAEANVLALSGKHRDAIESFRALESEIPPSRTSELASVIANLGYCYREVGDFDRALCQFNFALGIQEDLGNRPAATRARWNIADVYAAIGQSAEADKRYRVARAEFAALGLVRDQILVGLSLTEVALSANRFDEAETLCREALAYFEKNAESYSVKAMTAVGYLSEAVRQRKANAAVAQAVRRYVTRLPQQPNLLFAPPPLP